MPSPTFYPTMVTNRAYQELEEKISKLEKVSGRNIDEIISLFASGYDLVRTEYKSFKDLQN